MMSLWSSVMLGLIILPIMPARAADLVEGQEAPEFALLDQTGTEHRLTDYRGQWVVLYFYPKDDTPGCTREACQFRDDILRLKAMGAVVLGVSLDDRYSHQKFAQKYSLPFALLSDTGGKVAEQYGSITGFGPIRFAKRHTFLIDPSGKLARVYRKVDPDTHSDQVIDDLAALQRERAS